MIEYSVFCADNRPLPFPDLAATLGEAGWSVRFVRDWLGPEEFYLVESGDLADGDTMIGWLRGNALSLQFDDALRAGDRQKIKHWIFNEPQLGKAMWSIDSPFVFDEHSGFDSLDDAREVMGDQYADHLARTTCMYHVDACPLFEFTAVVMGAAALLRDGMAEDPQEGIAVFPPSNVAGLANFIDEWPTE